MSWQDLEQRFKKHQKTMFLTPKQEQIRMKLKTKDLQKRLKSLKQEEKPKQVVVGQKVLQQNVIVPQKIQKQGLQKRFQTVFGEPVPRQQQLLAQQIFVPNVSQDMKKIIQKRVQQMLVPQIQKHRVQIMTKRPELKKTGITREVNKKISQLRQKMIKEYMPTQQDLKQAQLGGRLVKLHQGEEKIKKATVGGRKPRKPKQQKQDGKMAAFPTLQGLVPASEIILPQSKPIKKIKKQPPKVIKKRSIEEQLRNIRKFLKKKGYNPSVQYSGSSSQGQQSGSDSDFSPSSNDDTGDQGQKTTSKKVVTRKLAQKM